MVVAILHGLVDWMCYEVSTFRYSLRDLTPFHSIKWVGAFVTALVGAYTIEDLWNKFGDLRLSWVNFVSHFSDVGLSLTSSLMTIFSVIRRDIGQRVLHV